MTTTAKIAIRNTDAQTVCPECGRSTLRHPDGVMIGNWTAAEIAEASLAMDDAGRHHKGCGMVKDAR